MFVWYIIEFIKKLRFNRKHRDLMKYVSVMSGERSRAITKAATAFKTITDDIIKVAGTGKLTRHQLLYLLERQNDPLLDYEENKAYDRVLRLYSDGGVWKRIHTLAVCDPNSKLLETFINSVDQIGGHLDGGPFVKLVRVKYAHVNMSWLGRNIDGLQQL